MRAKQLNETDFRALSHRRLKEMAEAGERVLECYRILRKTNFNIVGEVLRNQGEFYEWDHYPDGDVYDHETHAQYYYHAHPPEDRPGILGEEHGHFHTFLRPEGFPPGIQAHPVPDLTEPEDPNDALSHIVAISMNQAGFPIRLFTTNRWVTGETWYAADDVIRMLDGFVMDLAFPSWPVNIWITEMIRLFRPQIERILDERDHALTRWSEDHPAENPYENRELEVPSYVPISVEKQIRATMKALEKR